MMRSAVIEGQRVLILSQESFQHWQFSGESRAILRGILNWR